MLDLSIFLTRWLFLSNLMRDVVEIQTLPHQPYYPPPSRPSSSASSHMSQEAWRDDTVRGILSYPPGSQRMLVMDALRMNLAHQLSRQLKDSEHILRRRRRARIRLDETSPFVKDDESDEEQESNSRQVAAAAEDADPYYDADTDILRHFQEDVVSRQDLSSPSSSRIRRAMLVISDHGNPNVIEMNSDPDIFPENNDCDAIGPARNVEQARLTETQAREYLPQLVSAVLKSPPAYAGTPTSPVQKLKQIMLNRCVSDPSWGIELCWLLEAQVGRAWKTIFEHRQQTGRRLIVFLPAEKASVMAKLGAEKRESFDFLQDVEQATAYGYTIAQQSALLVDDDDEASVAPRLPSALSLRRCSHFGDTMHFVDKFTKISLDLQRKPVLERHGYLLDQLDEINRRLRRRMVTRGEITLDVEDDDRSNWPQLDDLTVDMLRYSVHFPLAPQTGIWPDGSMAIDTSAVAIPSAEVVRVLNIVTSETRILASRERCPFLVHLEVADTGLGGSDARLYMNGAEELGTTIEEALNLAAPPHHLSGSTDDSNDTPDDLWQAEADVEEANMSSFRGGWQGEDGLLDDGTSYLHVPPHEIRQHQYEQLHQQWQTEAGGTLRSHTPAASHTLSMGTELLDKVFGQPWHEMCRQIRANSPFGHIKGWRLASFIMKAGEDIRRESLVMQVIAKLRKWFHEEITEAHRPFLRPYTIMCVGGDTGLVECLSDAKSVDEVKKRTDGFESIRDYFERAYGPPSHKTPFSSYGPPPDRADDSQVSFEIAQDNFLRSLVAYSLLCYILQVKDRHNANILLDREGHIVHIDFGYVLGDSPKMGKVPLFSERAPFKLSQEFWDVLGGWNLQQGGLGVRFCKMFEMAFACASKHADEIATLVEATMLTLDETAHDARVIANGVRARLRMRGPFNSFAQKSFVMDLVQAALTSWGTSTYDWLQRSMNGYQ